MPALRARPGESPDGHCRRFDEPAWASVAFSCNGYEPADPAARALDLRFRAVQEELRKNPELRVHADVSDAPMNSETGAPLSVALALRHGERIICFEMHMPRERWDRAHFLKTLTEATGRLQ